MVSCQKGSKGIKDLKIPKENIYLIASAVIWAFALFVVLPISVPVGVAIMVTTIIADIYYIYKDFSQMSEDLHKELYDER